MAEILTSEGQTPFKIPGENDIPCSTYYKIFGDLSSGATPVVVLHGGPGGGHEYLLSFAELWPKYGLPVVFYDQIGCGASTHLPQMAGDTSFWQESLFIADRPRGLQRLILASGVATMELSVQSIKLCRSKLPTDLQRVLDKCEREASYEGPAYKEALSAFHKTFVCRAEPVPAELALAFQHLSEDRTVYGTMYGPSVFNCNGSLRSWTSISRLPQITAPTLVYNGEYDTSQDIGQEPFFEFIPRVRWITFPGGSHMCHLDGGGLRERVLKVVGEFLIQHKVAEKTGA
ncbi:Alpha/Beta hydrolase protein [Hypoxylon sp. FL1857]|nr:Alpha/Beta hydrolase protein [Hypoxylon sp. FL1857]